MLFANLLAVARVAVLFILILAHVSIYCLVTLVSNAERNIKQRHLPVHISIRNPVAVRGQVMLWFIEPNSANKKKNTNFKFSKNTLDNLKIKDSTP